MKRIRINFIGNVFMGIGLLGMFGGISVSIFSYMPESGISDAYTHIALAALFCGALVWLMGAKMSGRERIEDRYWSICHCQKRKQRHS